MANGRRDLHRRVSRTDLDFEQALRGGGTVVLREGLDVNSLGLDTSPSPMKQTFMSPTPPPKGNRYTGSTTMTTTTISPSVVPPTPTPSGGASGLLSSSPSAGKTSDNSASSSQDVFYDAEDGEIQTKRRSLYRSPGTSSSPDLATLVRKAKQRGQQVVMNNHYHNKGELTPALPTTVGITPGGTVTRSRAPTTSSSSPSSPSKTKSKTNGQGRVNAESAGSPSGSDWVFASPVASSKPKEGESLKPKSSMRAKTSAFLGKMLGQGTVRERSKTDASLHPVTISSSYASPPLFNAFSPPVPPLPSDVQRNLASPSPIADAFSTQGTSKPLPRIAGNSKSESPEDPTSASNKRPSSSPRPPPETGVKYPDTKPYHHHTKKRSMTIGEFELKHTSPPLPTEHGTAETQVWDATLNGIISDFKDELFQLDPISGSSFDSQDPSTDSRQPAKPDRLVLASHGGRVESDNTPSSPSFGASATTPTVILRPSAEAERGSVRSIPSSPVIPTIVSPRNTSLQTPTLSHPSPASAQASGSKQIPTLRSRNVNSFCGLSTPTASTQSRDSSRLRIQHRSTASSSEPSLIREVTDSRVVSPTLTVSSQLDLTTSDLVLTRFASNQSPAGDETVDIQRRGKELATRCWVEDEEFLQKEKIAEWLGGQGRINKVAVHYYLNFLDFSSLRLDLAFRRLCSKLYLKAETQQVDRILEEFSRRYWECNPTSVYGSASVVHSVSYSLLLLNTDLHVADLSTRMSRSQFVRNTLAAIRLQLQPTPSQTSVSDLNYDDGSVRGSDGTETTVGTSTARSKRSGSITSWSSISRDLLNSASGLSLTTSPTSLQPSNGSSLSIQVSSSQDAKSASLGASSVVYNRNWENEMESLLKEMYNAIKSQQILQPLNSAPMRSSMSSLSPGPSTLIRNRSLRGQPDRLTTLKRGSIRGLQSILGGQTGNSPYSSNSSIDGRVSPSPSFSASTQEGIHGSSSSFLPPTLGFASNLSHTIIREAQEDDDRSVRSHCSDSTTISITDEELALLGAPWAKEGMLCRKQYWESTGKRARDKSWMDVFVVIQKGELNMFVFGQNAAGGSKVVGGGNWLANAHPVGTVHLAHSLGHALPPPGYNRQRPHCMVLTLSNGGVYFFQAGTEELVNEWVSTCNYWAARTSKEPLSGGVSNMEYGWNRVEDPVTRGRSTSDTESTREQDYSDAMSIRSGRSSRSRFGWREGVATVRAAHSPYVDRVVISEWKPPSPPTVSSVHDEETQMEALQKYVASMKDDLKRHNELREPMLALYSPRSSNSAKAQSNWEKRSQYLLTEIVKYDSYIDSLHSAMTLRLKKRGEKALERALQPDDDDSPMTSKEKKKGEQEKVVDVNPESEMPITPGVNQRRMSQMPRREKADGG